MGVDPSQLGSRVIRECKRLIDELCWCGVKRLGITNGTNKRISRMLNGIDLCHSSIREIHDKNYHK